MEQNPIEYNEIKKLAALMTAEGIPFERREMYNGEMLILWSKGGNCLADVVEHDYSHGSEEDLLEIMGAMTEEESSRDSTLGSLTAEDVLKRFKYCYEHSVDTLPTVDGYLAKITAHEKLKAFINDPRNMLLTDEEAITLFLQENFAILCNIAPSLINYLAKCSVLLEHKVNVKDEYLITVQDWLKGEIHKDNQFHPELKDKMLDNITRALEI